MYSIDDIILFMTLTYFIPCSISPFLFFFYFFPLHPHFYSSAAHNATSTFHTKFKYRYEIFFILYRDKAKGHNYIFQFFIYPFILIYFSFYYYSLFFYYLGNLVELVRRGQTICFSAGYCRISSMRFRGHFSLVLSCSLLQPTVSPPFQYDS